MTDTNGPTIAANGPAAYNPVPPEPIVPLAIELDEDEDEDKEDDLVEIRGMIEEAVRAVLSPMHDKVRLLQQQLAVTSADPTLAHIDEFRMNVEGELAAADVALVDVNMRLDRIEEHVGLKPSLLSAVEGVVGELDEAAQAGRLTPAHLARLHRKLRAATNDERTKRVNGA